MFKVPDWGNDIPKSKVDVTNLFNKTNKKKNARNSGQSQNNHSVSSVKINKKKLNDKAIKKSKNNMHCNAIIKSNNKINGHVKLTKDDHINNRIAKRNLKKMTTDINTENHINEAKSTQKSNSIHNGIDATSKIKHKIRKRKGKLPKVVSNINNGEKISNSSKTHENETSIKDMNDINKQSRKRKQCHKKDDNTDLQSLDSGEENKKLSEAKRKKLNDKIKTDNVQEGFSNKESNKGELNKEMITNPSKLNRILKKKEKLKEILEKGGNRNIIKTNSNKLRERMLDRLKAAQFRYLNEKLYTSSGSESQELFKSDPVAFQTYHEGYQLQVKKWPVNPLDLIVKRIQKMPKTHLIADMGCGEASLSKRVSQTVRSFDLVATAPGVEACNMAHTPLLAASMDVVVFCLALMGTDLTQYLIEANRVLKIGGHLLVAEVESRFDNVETFSSDVQRLGFSLKKMDKSHEVFFFMEFNKVRDVPSKRAKLPQLSLKPCLYKKR